MGIFDPVVDAEVNPPAPVATPAMPSAAGGFGQIFGGIVNAIGQAQQVAGSGGPSRTDLRAEEDRLRTVGLTDALLENNALWEESPGQARAREAQILLNYTRDGGDLSGESFQNTYRLTTGRNPDHIGMSDTDVMIEAVMETPEYQAAWTASLSTVPDATEEERQAYALGRVATAQAHQQILLDNQISWPEREGAFLGVIDGWLNESLGAMRQLSVVGEMEVNAAQQEWALFSSNILSMRPQGISDTDWSNVQARIDGVGRVIELMGETAGLAGIEANARDEMARILYNQDIPPAQILLGINVLGDFAEAIRSGAINPTNWQEFINGMMVARAPAADGVPPDSTGMGMLGDPTMNPTGEIFPEAVTSTITEDFSVTEYFNQVVAANGFIGSATSEDYSTPDRRDGIARILQRGFAAMVHAGSENQFATARGLDRALGRTALTAIDRIAQHDPAAARTLYMQASEAVNTQGAAAHATFQQMLSRNPDVIHENGQIIVTEDWLIENAGLSEQAASEAARAASNQGITLTEWVRSRATAGSGWSRALNQIDELQAQGEIVQAYDNLAGVYSARIENSRPETAPTMAEQEGLLGTMTAGGTYRPMHTPQEMRLAIGADATNLNPAFADGLTGLLNAARAEGIQVTINNSYRSPETQASLIASYWGNYNLNPADRERWLADVEQYGPVAAGQMWESTFTNATRLSDGSPMRNWIALPGRSNHQHGLAADLSYGSQGDIDWVHANAARFGLHFPLGNENWHVEVMGSRDGTVGRHQIGRDRAGDPLSMEAGIDRLLQERGSGSALAEAFVGPRVGTGAVPEDEAVAFNEAVAVDPDAALMSEMMGSAEVGQLAEATAAAEARDEEERGVAAQQEAQALTASEVLDDRMMRQLRQLGGSELTPAYTSVDEASEAIRRGELRSGMAFVLNGQIRVYEEPDG